MIGQREKEKESNLVAFFCLNFGIDMMKDMHYIYIYMWWFWDASQDVFNFLCLLDWLNGVLRSINLKLLGYSTQKKKKM